MRYSCERLVTKRVVGITIFNVCGTECEPVVSIKLTPWSYSVKNPYILSHKYPSDLTDSQILTIQEHVPEIFKTRSCHHPVRIINAILFLIKSGCQWAMLPASFPKWRCVYHHFRTWSAKGFFNRLMNALTRRCRCKLGKTEQPEVAIADSQSVKWGLIQSEKGIDGAKKVKGIKRHIIVDSNGLPLAINITKANRNDGKGIIPLIACLCTDWQGVTKIKADLGYQGSLREHLPQILRVDLDLLKSNYGTYKFVPVDGRWVVERTFSWLDSYRRLARNYEKYLYTALAVTTIACCMMLLRHF